MKKACVKTAKTMMLPVILYLIFLIPNPARFGSINCLYTIFIQSIIPSVLGYGICFGFISGIFDFSIGSRTILASLIGGILSMQYGLWGLILGCIISSIIIGIFTGLVNWAARIPSLVVTLGLTMIFEIIALQISGKTSLVSLSRELSILGRPPYIIITLAISFILFYLAFYHTRFSYHARAIGSDEMIAQNMGIKIQWIKFLTFVVGGAFLGIASILQISVSGSISAQVDLGSAMLLFKPLMGVMVAIALQSICNLAVGIIIGEFSINMIFVGLIASGLPDTFQNVTLGLFLLIVMFLSVNKGGITKCFKRKPNVSIPGNAA